MTDTTIYIAGVAIHEPVTVFTDVIIAILCFIFTMKLQKGKAAMKRWRLFFFFFGLSTLIGSFSHAFFGIHTGLFYKLFWIPMQLLNGLAVYFAQAASLDTVLAKSPSKKIMQMVFYIQLILFLLAVFYFQNFLVVVINNALGLIPLMIIHFKNARNKGDRMIAYGILVSFLTGIVHGFKLSIGPYFNYNDIAHVLIMLSLYIMFRGIIYGQTSSASQPA